MSLLPVGPAHELPQRSPEDRWLIDQLWSEEAVGLVAGEAKSCKSFMALHMAVAVASGKPCLRRFAVARPGRVLLFAAEDPPHVVRQRLEGIAIASGLNLDALDIQVITAPYLWLDDPDHVERLYATVGALQPRLLVLDPFVRLHAKDENASSAIAPLLALLRELQRLHHMAVVVVHHAKKGAGRMRAGQALRGTSEFFAWLDSMLYLRRQGDALSLLAQHRAAASLGPLQLRLVSSQDTLALEVVDSTAADDGNDAGHGSMAPDDRIRAALAAQADPMSLGQLREVCRMRKATLCATLGQLVHQGALVKTASGYALTEP